MNYRLKTSKNAQLIMQEIKDRTGITPNILSRYAISLAAISDEPIDKDYTDQLGQEFNRNILLGDFDKVCKLIIETKENKHLEDEEYFPEYVKAYIEEGVKIMYGNFILTKNKDNFIRSLAGINFGGD